MQQPVRIVQQPGPVVQQPGPVVQQPGPIFQQPGPNLVVQQPGLNLVVQQPARTAPQRGSVRKGFAKKTITSFSITQIVAGILAIIFCSVTLGVECNSYVSYIGTGIWVGIFVIVTGSVGCVSGYKKSNCMIITYMILSIITAVIAGIALLPMSAVGIARERECTYGYHHYYDWYDNGGRWSCDYNRYATCVASHSINLIISIVVSIIAIIGACLCCRAVCCKRGPERAIHYVPSGQPGNVPFQYPMVNVATPQGAPMVYMIPSTGMQVITSQGVQPQPMVVPGYNYQQQQPTMMMAQGQSQPQPQQQVYAVQQPGPQGQHNAGADLGAGASSPPPAYSSSQGNTVPEKQALPM